MAQLAIAPTHRMRFTAAEREYVYSVAMKYVKNDDAAEDVAQEALLLAYRHRASFRGQSRYTTWLYRIAATTALMHLRKQRRLAALVTRDAASPDEDGALPELADPAASPEAVSAATEELTQAAQKLDALGEKYGRIFTMRFVEGRSDAEIAAELELNAATVKTRAYRARAALRRATAL